MALQHSPSIVTTGLLYVYDAANPRSYSGSGTNWSDGMSTGQNLTLVNNPIYTSGVNGYFTFDGVDDNCTGSTTIGSMGTGNWSISYWWKSNGTQPNYCSVIGQGFTGSPSNGAWTSKVSHTSGNVNFTYYNNGIVDNLSSTNPNDNIWHNLVTVRNGTSLIVYMDTVSVLSITLPAAYSFGSGATTYVGYNPRDNVYLKGYISQVIFYNSALSTSNITQNFNALRGRYGV